MTFTMRTFNPRALLKWLAATCCVALLLTLHGCGCGFDCNSDDDDDDILRGTLDLGFSDEPLEDLKAVVIQVTGITLRRSNAEDVVIDTFTIPELGLLDAESFQIDLLDYRGRNQLLVVTGLEIDTGSYSGIDIAITGSDINTSYVQQSDDVRVPISVLDGVLDLPGFSMNDASEAYTVEFGLALALRERPAFDDYRLDEVGVRVEDASSAASITGRVDSDLFDTVTDCAAKDDPERGNRVYLYSGVSLGVDNLADVFRDSSATSVPTDAIAPLSVATLVENALTGNWEYAFGYLPSGDYTLSFSCNSDNDDAVDYDGIVIPLPDAQRYEINLNSAEQATCDLEEAGNCS